MFSQNSFLWVLKIYIPMDKNDCRDKIDYICISPESVKVDPHWKVVLFVVVVSLICKGRERKENWMNLLKNFPTSPLF